MFRVFKLSLFVVLLMSMSSVFAADDVQKSRAEKKQERIEKQRAEVIMAGTWALPDGAGSWVMFYIREGGGPLLYIPKNNAPGVRWMNWVPGMDGTQFVYTAPDNRPVTMTQNPANPAALNVAWADGRRETLSRIARVKLDSPIYGAWKGDWGGTVHLVEVGKTIYHVHVSTKGKYSVATGSWVPGMEGTQYTYKYPDTEQRTGTLNAKGTPRIMLAGANGKRWAMVRFYQPMSALDELEGQDKRAKRRFLAGVWRHPRLGDLVLSANKRDFHVAKLVQTDATFDLKAGWTRDMRGVQFELIFRGETITCTYNKRKPAMLRCTDSAGSTTEWQKQEP